MQVGGTLRNRIQCGVYSDCVGVCMPDFATMPEAWHGFFGGGELYAVDGMAQPAGAAPIEVGACKPYLATYGNGMFGEFFSGDFSPGIHQEKRNSDCHLSLF